MNLVNYGTPVEWVTVTEHWPPREVGGDAFSGCSYIHAEHTGADGHDQMKPGEQCECGVLALGLIRRDP